MKKILKIWVVITFLAVSGLSFGLSQNHPSGATLHRPTLHGTVADKRCEKCKRGPDGKMVCEEVPCPK